MATPFSTLRWLPSFGLLLLVGGSGAPPVVAAEKVSGHLSVRDQLSMPGKPARIEARLFKPGLLGQSQGQGLGGERLELLVGGAPAGLAMTGGDGRAFFDSTCRARGNQTVTVRLADKKRVESPEASGLLACWERRRPMLLVDIGTLVKKDRPSFTLPGLPALSAGGDSPEVEADAAEELKRLTDYFYNPLYLSWPESTPASGGDVRAWLKQSGFPPGPVLTLPAGAAGVEELLDRLKGEGWENVKGGIGRTKAFAEALLNRRMQVVILPSGGPGEALPRKAKIAKNWKEVRKKLRS